MDALEVWQWYRPSLAGTELLLDQGRWGASIYACLCYGQSQAEPLLQAALRFSCVCHEQDLNSVASGDRRVDV